MDLFNLCMIFVGYAIICNYCNESGSCSISPNKQASDHCKTQSSSRLPIEDLIALIPDSLGSWEGRLSSDGDSTSIGNGDSKSSDEMLTLIMFRKIFLYMVTKRSSMAILTELY